MSGVSVVVEAMELIALSDLANEKPCMNEDLPSTTRTEVPRHGVALLALIN